MKSLHSRHFLGYERLRKYKNNKKWLYQKYIIEKLNTYEIANLISCEHKAICRWLEKFNIPRRTRSEVVLLNPIPFRKFGSRLCGDKNPAKRPEVRKKISKTMKGRYLGKNNPMYGKKCPEHSLRMLGKSNPNWLGGISFEPYGLVFNKNLKEQIRKRDYYTCQVSECNLIQNGKKFPIHHVDYDKKNNEGWNLITLCHSCHPKTNHNRQYWQSYFEFQISLKGIN